jgi:hypothetical protein
MTERDDDDWFPSLEFRFSNFEFVSDFELRISDLGDPWLALVFFP